MGRKNKNKFKNGADSGQKAAGGSFRSFADLAEATLKQRAAALATTVRVAPTVLAARTDKERASGLAKFSWGNRTVSGKDANSGSEKKAGSETSFLRGFISRAHVVAPKRSFVSRATIIKSLVVMLVLAGVGYGGWQGYSAVSSIKWSSMLAWANPSGWITKVSGQADQGVAQKSSSTKPVQHSARGSEPKVVKSATQWTEGAAFGDGKVRKPPTAADKRRIAAEERAFRKLPVSEKRKAWQGKIAEIKRNTQPPTAEKMQARPQTVSVAKDRKASKPKAAVTERKLRKGDKASAASSKSTSSKKSGTAAKKKADKSTK